MWVSGSKIRGMGLGFKHGQTVQNMKENGPVIEPTVKGNLSTPTVIFTMATGLTTRLMVGVFTSTKTGPPTMVSG